MQIFLFSFYFLFSFLKITKSQNCLERACIECPKQNTICERCQNNYKLHNNKCGIKCDSIKNCDLCDSEFKKCVKCKENCKVEGTECDCTERTKFIIIISILCVVFLAIIIYCILCNIFSKKTFNIEMANIEQNTSEAGLNNIPSKAEILSSFLKNKIEVDKDIVNKKCLACKANQCNLKYDCGCYLCYDCDKKTLKNKICLACGKGYLYSQQISCSFCYETKLEVGYLNCKCKLVLCKDCYVFQRTKSNTCPTCKGIIS